MCLSNTQTVQDSVVTAVNEISFKMFNLPYTNHTGLFAQTHFLNFEISSKILSLYSRKILGKGEQNVGENQLKIKITTYRPTTGSDISTVPSLGFASVSTVNCLVWIF